MQVLPYLLAILAGFLNPVQSAMNGSLNQAIERPLVVTLVSLVCSLLGVSIVGALAGRLHVPLDRIGHAPWWAWFGGLCGAVLVISQPVAALKLGGGTFIGITVTAATLGSLLLDNFGLLGFHQHPLNAARAVGALLMIAGVTLIALF